MDAFRNGASPVLVHNDEVCVGLLNGRQLGHEFSGSKIKRLRKDMETNGFDAAHPIEVAKVNGYLVIIDGHHRARAAGAAGITHVPVIFKEVSVELGKTLLVQASEAMGSIGRYLRRFSQ